MDKGQAEPLGATRLEDGSVNFALYSRHAEGVVLCLYEAFSPEPSVSALHYSYLLTTVLYCSVVYSSLVYSCLV